MSYHHLTGKEREMIAQSIEKGQSIRTIARVLERSAGTISREVRRNTGQQGYTGPQAQACYKARRKNSHRKELHNNQRLCEYVIEKLGCAWSPEQIAGRIKLEYAQDKAMRISHSTIYRWLYEQRVAQASVLQLHLRHGRRKGVDKRGKFHGIRELKERSRQVLKRKRIGDWEADTIVSSNGRGNCLLSVCERKSRYCGLVLLRKRTAEEVMRGFWFLFEEKGLPLTTITADRGKEFACYAMVEEELRVPFYFTRPSSPWQKGSVENLNGLVRQFFPKGTQFQELTPQNVAHTMDLLNNRPRKVLNWLTPAEVLHLT